jgi:acetyl-CoA decarbonylase/synthase complex subunit delta
MKKSDSAQNWSSAINTITLGGGKRKEVTVGGAKCVSWMSYEGDLGNPPALAVEIWDVKPENWPAELVKQYGDAMGDPVAWAKKAMELKPDLLCLKLMGTHPDGGNKSPDDAAAIVKNILAAVDVPLIIWGCGAEDKDNAVLPKCSEVAKGENCLMGSITDKNYRTLVAACLADGHKIIAESPLDINIAKQVNILAHDAGFPLESIVVFPTTAALGYGFEYVYSIMERGRLAGLGGDPLLKQPVICDVGAESWRAKEAQAGEDLLPGFGPVEERGPMWETITGTNLLQAGSEIIIHRHPKALAGLRATIDRFTKGAKALAA